jgi:peroxiredoxin
VSLVAISVDTLEESVGLAGKLDIQYPLLSDEGLKTALAYGVAMDGDDIAVPSVFIVGTDMKVKFAYVGESVTDRPSPDRILELATAKTP